MPNRILDCDLTVNAGGTVNFHVRIVRPPGGEPGNASAAFSSSGAPEVDGFDSADVDSADPLTSDPFQGGDGEYTASVEPAEGTWDDVQDCNDLVATADKT